MDAKTPIQPQVPVLEQPVNPEVLPNQNSKKMLFLVPILFIVILIIVGGAYFFSTKNKPKVVSHKTSPTPTIDKKNLNPNTGNLYEDVKVRLKEVMK